MLACCFFGLVKAKSKLDKKTAGNKKKTSPSPIIIMVGYDDELLLILQA